MVWSSWGLVAVATDLHFDIQTANADTRIVKTLDGAIEKITGIKPKHSTAGGTSDARFIAEYGIDVIEFGVKNDTIHAPNERTSVDEVEKLYDVFCEVIRTY